MTGITVRHIDGRLLAVKRAGADNRERLDHEREVLARIDHPGVVQLVAIDHEDFGADTLATRFVGPDNWEQRPPTSAAEIVAATAMLAATLADLHDLGLSHGSVRPEHVVVAADGRPVLCGLADALPADDESRRADLAAFGDVVADLAVEAPRTVASDFESIAARCRDGSIDAAAASRLLDGLDPIEQPHRRPSARTSISGAVGAVGFGALLWLVLAGDPRPPADAAPTSPSTTAVPTEADDPMPVTSPPPTTTTPVSNTESSTTNPTTTSSPTTSPPTSTRPPTTTITTPAATTSLSTSGGAGDPPELVHDGRRYRVGRAGDMVVAGDWNCDGTPTPAVLRPSTGEVAAFDEWPRPDGDVTPTWIEIVDAADQIEVETVDGCDRVRVRSGDSSRLVGAARR